MLDDTKHEVPKLGSWCSNAGFQQIVRCQTRVINAFNGKAQRGCFIMALSVPNTVHTSISRLGKDKEYVELPLYRGKYTKFHSW